MALRDVELVEDEAPEPGRGPAGEGDRRAAWRRHPRLAAAVAVVLVVAVGAAVVLDLRARARDAARAEALRALPGVLAPVDPALPVRELVVHEPEQGGPPLSVLAMVQGVRAGDVVVVGTVEQPPGSDGGTVVVDPATGAEVGRTATARGAVVGVDPATGAELWRTAVPPRPDLPDRELAHVSCTGSQEDLDPFSAVRAPRVDEGVDEGTVGCTATWTVPLGVAGTGDDDPGRTAATTVLALDPADGRVLHTGHLPATTAVTRVRDGWVTTSASEGPVVAELLGDDGTTRWRSVLEESRAAPPPWSGPAVAHGRVLVATSDAGAWVLALADGAVVQRVPDVEDTTGRVLPGDAGVVLTEYDQPQTRGVLHRPDGTRDDLDGESLVPVAVDDGSLGDVLLTGLDAVGGHVTLRRGDGTPVWRSPAPLAQAMVVDGTVVGVTAGEVVRLEGADGARRWSAPRPVADLYPLLLTDGAAVLVTTSAGVDAWTFDGEPAWSGRVVRDSGVPTLRAVRPSPVRGAGDEAPLEVLWSVTADGRLLAELTGSARYVLLVVG